MASLDEERLLMEYGYALLQNECCALYTGDGSVDISGKPALKHKTGSWKACSFIIGTECCERFAYYGIATNLITYLTSKLHQGNVSAARNISIWQGTCYLTPLLGAVLADGYWGRYWTTLVAAFVYLLGLCALTLSASVPALMPAECLSYVCPPTSASDFAVFFCGLYLVALGTGGIKTCVPPFGADQFDATDSRESLKKGSFFNWYYFITIIGGFMSSFSLVWIQDHIGWGVGFGIPALFMVISIIVFLSGMPLYRFKKSRGSPFARILQVLIASCRKWNVVVPKDSSLLYETLDTSSKLEHTDTLKLLDKAAVQSEAEVNKGKNSSNPWRLCTVTQVEELKTLICLLPVWATGTASYVFISQDSLFVVQGMAMDRTIAHSFTISAAAFSNVGLVAVLFLVLVYDRLIVPTARRFTANEQGFSQLQRMGIGLSLGVAYLATAATLEAVRLERARELGSADEKGSPSARLSILWQTPQYVLGAAMQVFTYVGQLEFFYEEAPETMRSLCSALVLLSVSIGYYLSSLVLTVVTNFTTTRDGKGGWIPDNLNEGRLDYYFWLLAALSSVNTFLYVICAKQFKSKKAS